MQEPRASPTSTSILVNNDNDLPAISFTLNVDTVSESGGYYAAIGTITRGAGNEGAFTVNLSNSPDGTLIMPASISFTANNQSKTFDIGVIDNTLDDGFRSFEIEAPFSYQVAAALHRPPAQDML